MVCKNQTMPAAYKCLAILLFALLLFLIPNKVKAADFDASKWNAKTQSNFSLETLEHGAMCEIAGTSPIGDCVGHKANGELSYYNQPGAGAIGGITSLMVAMYATPPTSSAQYIADIGNNLGLIKPAYAQTSVAGSGEGIIRPVRNLWQVMRNVAYLGFIFVFLAVGLMIMFRQKINPQTVISAQTALPGLVIGLILVTFSYFIAALIIDLSFVGVQLVAQIFTQAGGPNAFDIQNLAQNSSVFSLLGSSLTRINPLEIGRAAGSTVFGSTGSFAVTSVITGIMGAIVGVSLFPALGPFALGAALLGGAVGAGAGPVILPGIVAILVPLILIIALFIQFFRLVFNLISTYIGLLVSTITGPLVILNASIPGRGGGLSNWWKSLLANSLVFPAVFGAFLFAGLILAVPLGTQPGTWGTTTPPLFGGLNTSLIKIIISYGILLGIPAIPDMVRNAFGIKGTNPLAQAALGGFMQGFGVVRTGATRLVDPILRERRAAEQAALSARYEMDPAKRAQMISQYPTTFTGWQFSGVRDYGIRQPARTGAANAYNLWRQRYTDWANTQPHGTVTSEAAYMAAMAAAGHPDPRPPAP